MMDTIKFYYSSLLVCLILITGQTSAQKSKYPEIGLPIPAFSFKHPEIAGTEILSSTNLQGKHYILDFWSTGCLACIANFQKMDTLNSKYSNELKIILVGLQERHRNIENFYKNYRKKFNLRISSVYDSTVFNAFVPSSVPHLIWVNDSGMVKAITGGSDVTEVNIRKFLKIDFGSDVTEVNIRKFLKGEIFSFVDLSFKARANAKASFNRQKPLLIDGNGGDDTSYLYRSIISKWDRGKGEPYFPPVYAQMISGKGRYMIIGAPIKVLYSLAFYGVISDFPEPFLEPEFSNDAINRLRKNFNADQRFNYCVELPFEVATKKGLMNKMQSDLASFFQLNARLSEKAMPCYQLVISDSARFSQLTKNAERPEVLWGAEYKTQRFSNIPVDQVISFITSKVLSERRIIIYNKTGFSGNLTFELKADVNDLDSIARGLQDVGLTLKPSTKFRKIIVVTGDH